MIVLKFTSEFYILQKANSRGLKGGACLSTSHVSATPSPGVSYFTRTHLSNDIKVNSGSKMFDFGAFVDFN